VYGVYGGSGVAVNSTAATVAADNIINYLRLHTLPVVMIMKS